MINYYLEELRGVVALHIAMTHGTRRIDPNEAGNRRRRLRRRESQFGTGADLGLDTSPPSPINMEHALTCNNLKCRKELGDRALVTTCRCVDSQVRLA